MDRVKSLSNVCLYVLGMRAFVRIERAMTAPYMGYQPFGWDMPTANMLHPTLVRMYYRVRDEMKARATAAGFKTVADFQKATIAKKHWTTGKRRFRRTLATRY